MVEAGVIILPTVDEIIRIAGIHPARVKNIYLFGSQVYGIATENSDFDFILVGSALNVKEEKRVGKINVHVHTPDIFKDELFRHDIHNLECYFAPIWAKLQEKELYSKFVLNPNKVKQSVLSESFSSWTKAKMKINQGDVFKGIKSLWHSIRMLYFGIDLVTNGKITQWDIANDLWNGELKDCDQYEWSYFKEKYFEHKLSLERKLKES